MLNKILFLLLSIIFLATKAQTNLVPNGSFENYSVCPNLIGQADHSNGWTILSSTPDYFNACSTNTCSCNFPAPICAGVPNNCFGFQYPASGNGYSGFFTYLSSSNNYREIIGSQLTNSLIIGQKYFVKFKLSFTWGYNSNTATDKLGVRFSTVQHNSITAIPPINNFAHIYSTTVINDTTNWTTIFKSFVADSNYSFVQIGNFFDDANTNKAIQWASASNWSYYYFDELCVSTDSLFTFNYSTGFDYPPSEALINISPNPTSGNYLYFKHVFSEANISILNNHGVLVKSSEIKSSDRLQLDLPNGIYFIKISFNEKLFTEKIIINN